MEQEKIIFNEPQGMSFGRMVKAEAVIAGIRAALMVMRKSEDAFNPTLRAEFHADILKQIENSVKEYSEKYGRA